VQCWGHNVFGSLAHGSTTSWTTAAQSAPISDLGAIASCFRTNVDTVECEACLPGSFADVAGLSACKQCTAGSSAPLPAAEVCEQAKCEIGSGMDESSGTCVPCAAGTYSDTADASACQLCPPNTFSTAVAATTASTCTNCTNSISPAGSSRGADCICTGGYARYP
jgi:hypothetical protein